MFCNEFFLGLQAAAQFLESANGEVRSQIQLRNGKVRDFAFFSESSGSRRILLATLVRLVGGSNPSYLSSSVLSLAVAVAVALTVAQP